MNRTLQLLLCAAGLLPGLAIAQTNGPARYQSITGRNVFGLKPFVPAPAVAAPAEEPREDLLLTGLTDVGSNRCASFMVTEPGKAASYFTLHEGEQNQWLEVRSIDLGNGTVKGFLKKPVVRMRSLGVEVVLSFQAERATPARHLSGKNISDVDVSWLARSRENQNQNQPTVNK